MRLLMTGASGYLGSRLAVHLLRTGDAVTALQRTSSARALPAGVVRRELVVGDLADTVLGYDAIVHAACDYGRDGASLARVAEANLLLPLRLLDAARASGVPLLLHIGTALPAETSPYALTKHQFTALARLDRREVPALIDLRVQQMYGPHEDDGRFVGRLVRGCLAGERVPLTRGEQVRDLVHVDDVVAAIDLALRRHAQALGDADYDVGTGVGLSIRRVAEIVAEAADAGAHLDFGAVAYRAREPMRCIADTAALRMLGWRPTIAAEDGLRAVVAAACTAREGAG